MYIMLEKQNLETSLVEFEFGGPDTAFIVVQVDAAQWRDLLFICFCWPQIPQPSSMRSA